MPSDDELARTATAPQRPSAKHVKRDNLGRFKLERELGAGGMGVVYAAFDPELERRVAVKVLRARSDDARTRLSREARAMAKLSHPNVITVFDVGSAGGEDFVAMELIDGGTLGDWLSTRPRPAEILAAFVAAGRGLDAAHSEGLVHRDFKPSNVLRSSAGRIVVTDFGLARAEGSDEGGGSPTSSDAIAFDQTQAPTAAALTRTGSLLGTPAYMSPEQWRFEPVTAATDQFAFCVALWEAFAGKRPFGGDTLEALKNDVLRGPAALDSAEVPRRLRPILRRGLALSPEQRWPSMTTLLAAIDRANARRRWIAAAAGAGVLGAGVAMFVATRDTAPPCAPPAVDPDAAALADAARPHVERWREVREHACEAPREVRSAQLLCLDGVVARIVDLFGSGAADPHAISAELVDPSDCERGTLPRLVHAIDPALAKAFAAYHRSRATWKPVRVVELTADSQPPCVRTLALMAQLVEMSPEYEPTTAATNASLSTQLESAAAACEDEPIKTLALLDLADPDNVDSIRRAEGAAKQFPTDANLARLDEIRAHQASRLSHHADALAAFERARARHAARGHAQHEINDVLHLARTHLARSDASDLAAVLQLAERYASPARALGRGSELTALAARARWQQGDIERADADARAAGYRYGPAPFVDSSTPAIPRVTGVVVDGGKPVANAKVVASAVMLGDDIELSSPVAHIATPVETTTGPDGTFVLENARGVVRAIAGDRVSMPIKLQPTVKVELGPTATVEGTVSIGDVPTGRVRVLAVIFGAGAAAFHAGPVDARGHFKLHRIPRAKVGFAVVGPDQVSGFNAKPREISEPNVSGIELVLERSAGQLYVVGRPETSTPPEGALVFVFRGARPDAKGTFREIFKLVGGPVGQTSLGTVDVATARPPFKGRVEADDLIGELPNRPPGDLTICGVGMSRKQLATGTSIDKMVNIIQDADVGCTIVPAGTELAIVPLPAIKRR